MKIRHIVTLFILMMSPSAFGESDNNHGFDLDKLEKVFQEGNQQSLEKIKEREGVDGPWMLQLFQDYRNGTQVTEEQLKHVWEIYKKENNHRIEGKLYAFSLIAEFEDISKWRNEFDSLAFSEDPKFVKTAIETVMWKLDRGTEREKIILSNKTAVLDHLVKFAQDNKADTTIHRDAVKMRELAEPYEGKTPSAELRRPDRRPSGSPTGGTRVPDERSPDSLAVGSSVQRTGKGGGLTFVGIIGIIIAAILIWRWKSKSTS